MGSVEVSLPNPFTGGWVTDKTPEELGPDEAVDLQDASWVSGRCGSRNALGLITPASGLGSANALSGALLWVTAAGQRRLVATNATTNTVGYFTSWGEGSATAAAVTAAIPSSLRYDPVATYQDEVILAPALDGGALDRKNLRWYGQNTTGLVATGGSVTITSGSDVVVGAGSNFTTQARVGCYLQIYFNDFTIGQFRITAIESATIIRVAHKVDFTQGGIGWACAAFGEVGLHTKVTDYGRASTAASTVTGTATTYLTGIDRARSADMIGLKKVGATLSTERNYVSGNPASDTTLTLNNAPGAAWASNEHVVARPLVGGIIAVHSGRLWAAGVPWAPRRVQVTPPVYGLGNAFNGVDSSTDNFMAAVVAESFEVPSADAPGSIVGLASLPEPGPLWIGATDACYIAYGEWPSVSVTKLGVDIGCLSRASYAARRDGVAWAGADGIFMYRPGGGVDDLTDGRMNRQWRKTIRDLTNAGGIAPPVLVAMIDGYLFVGLPSNETWVCEIEKRRWCKWTVPISAVASALKLGFWSQGVGLNGEQEVYATTPASSRLVAFSHALDAAGIGTYSPPNFTAQTGNILDGDSDRLSRPTYLQTTTSGSAAVSAVTSAGTSLMGSPTSAITDMVTTRMRPTGAGAIGAQSRFFAVKVAAQAAGNAVRVGKIVAGVRRFRPNA